MLTRENKELKPIHGSQKSYGHKAYCFTKEYSTPEVVLSGNGGYTWIEKGLTSYGQAVIWMHDDADKLFEHYHVAGKWDWQSKTTKRHIVEYWLQFYGRYYSKGDDGYYSNRVDDDTARKLIAAAFDFIYSCNSSEQVVTWRDIYGFMDYAYNMNYAIGGKAWAATLQNACEAIAAGVPAEDVLA